MICWEDERRRGELSHFPTFLLRLVVGFLLLVLHAGWLPCCLGWCSGLLSCPSEDGWMDADVARTTFPVSSQ